MLRSSLTLSLLTGQPFEMKNIRSRRKKPGLMPQHLKAVEAAGIVGGARIQGAQIGSGDLIFEPTAIQPGNFRFDIGTAGSTSLVLQSILPALGLARGSSQVSITGGTHVPWSPCFHYLNLHWLYYLRAMGYEVQLDLETAGFYPIGGGRVNGTVLSVDSVRPLTLTHRGMLTRFRGVSAVANLDASVAERQKAQAVKRLKDTCDRVEIEIVRMPSPSRGTVLLLIADFENSQACFFSLGALGKPAERVADEAVDEALEFLASDGAIDHHLADQLVLPLALAAGESTIRTPDVTQHLVANAAIINTFLPDTVEISAGSGSVGVVCIHGRRLSA